MISEPGFVAAREQALEILGGSIGGRDDPPGVKSGRRLLFVVLLVAAWQLAASTGFLADVLGLDSFLVPSPAEIADSLATDRSLLAENAWVTFQEVIAGFAAALVLGVGTAALLHISPLLKRISYPLVVASQTIPVIVIAPILVVWFGFGIGPKIAIIALICFFPITVNTLDGLGHDARRPAQAASVPRCRAPADPDDARGADRAALHGQRRQDRGRRSRDRRRLRRVGRGEPRASVT